MSIADVTILAGPVVPVVLPAIVSDALIRVEIDAPLGRRATCRLYFDLDADFELPSQFLTSGGDLTRTVIVVNAGPAPSVAFDGVMVTHSFVAAPRRQYVIAGEDLTVLMDLVERDRTFTGMPAPVRVQTILAAYGGHGIVALVRPPPITDVPLPTAISVQAGTDYAYVRDLAESIGFRFTLDPGPVPGTSFAVWAAEPRADRGAPSQVLDADEGRVTGLVLSFDAGQPVQPSASIVDPATHTVIPIPPPSITALVPPLGTVVPPPHRVRQLRLPSGTNAAQAVAAMLGVGARSAEAGSGHGVMQLGAQARRLRTGEIVEVRGVSKPFDGLYMVSGVRDVITPDAYEQEFDLLRAGFGG